MSASAADPIAVLGLGAMGSRVAARLLGTGHAVRVWNRSDGPAARLAQAGAVVSGSAGAAAADAAVVLVCVRDDEASRAVWAAVRRELGAAAIAVELSTVSPGRARALAAELGERFLAAPMVGSRPQVDAGQLALLVGGTAATLERARPVLDGFAGAVHHVGAPGEAAVLKLVVNGLLAAQLTAVGELLEVIRRAGLDEASAVALLAALPVTSPAVARSLPRIVAGDTAPAFPLELAAKDLDYLLAEAGVAPLLGRVAAALRERVDRGAGARDIVALAQPGT